MSFMNGSPITTYRPGINLPLMRVSKTLANINALREEVRIAIAKGIIVTPEQPEEPPKPKFVRNSVLHTLKCKRCNSVFESTVKTAQLCSPLCRHRDYCERKKGIRAERLLKKSCLLCESTFETFKKAAQYCKTCRSKPGFSTYIKKLSKQRAKMSCKLKKK